MILRRTLLHGDNGKYLRGLINMIIDEINRSIDFWIDALNDYSFEQLCQKPSPDSWSMGQMYQHLLNDTAFYLDQAAMALTDNENSTKTTTAEGRKMLDENAFPDARLEGHPSNAMIPQPVSKGYLHNSMKELKFNLNGLASKIASTSYQGKSKHPGLGYFSAIEWLQFADMHLRHHVRQKARIDEFISQRR